MLMRTARATVAITKMVLDIGAWMCYHVFVGDDMHIDGV